MTKKELINAILSTTSLSKVDASLALDKLVVDKIALISSFLVIISSLFY